MPRNKRHVTSIVFFYLVALFTGCAKEINVALNLTSPEGAFESSFRAVKYKQYGKAIQCMSKNYRIQFGEEENSQIRNLERMGKNMKYKKSWQRVITKVEYGPFDDGSDVHVLYAEYEDNKVKIQNAIMPFIREDGLWKIALLKSDQTRNG